ncbi:hypothetical protein C5L38_33795 (plasmid) [Streptomyces sp. WAC00288]|uniref:hypothetical protein n=1 Tax=unclassified Streptomyces TaxID=2593676 RepID=UPI000B1F4E1F|nr:MULTISPECIES: hypothetical protein [unclassified Streptomyces]AVI00054.1 hypothetical protein C5L38_33795 [Streptomyces sp. WAC00288]
MTDTALPADAEHTTSGRRLSPRDESRLSYALIAYLLTTKAADAVPVTVEPAPGDLLRDALNIARRAQQLVDAAVIAERERGTTWDQIGAAVGTTRQAAHERWRNEMRSWAANGRCSLPNDDAPDSLERAASIDSLYSDLYPDRPDAVTSGLDAVRFPGSREYEASLRTQGTALRSHLAVLLGRSSELDAEQKRAETAGDSAAMVAAAASKAECDQEVSSLYRQLASTEPALAEEHLHEAEGYELMVEICRRIAEQHA